MAVSGRAASLSVSAVAWKLAGELFGSAARSLRKPRGTFRIEPLERRMLLSGATPIISEFEANNNTGIQDEDGAHSDWIELYNPTGSDVSLGGYYLTDDPADLTKWQMPNATLPSGGFLVVFADGKNRTDLSHPLHTNFGLSSSGEYVGLIAPDGQTILSDYTYPQQVADVAYGVTLTQTDTHFISTAATARTLVPTDNSLAQDWTQPLFNDGDWQRGTTGVGYETETPIPLGTGFSVRMVDTQGGTTGDITDISKATSLLNGTLPAGSFNVAFDGTVNRPVVNFGDNANNFLGDLTLPNGAGGTAADESNPQREQYALRVTSNVTIPVGTYTIDVNSDDGFLLRIPGVTFTNRVNQEMTGVPQPEGADTLAYGTVRGAADTLGTFTVTGAPLTTTVNLDYYERTGGDSLELAVATGFRTAFPGSGFQLLGDGVDGWSVIDPNSPTAPNYRNLIGTDVQSQMYNTGQNTAYVRVPFTVQTPGDFDTVRLRMKYDDGFVAYLNGKEVWRKNAPATLAYSSSATATHADTDALNYESISLPASDLIAGANVLAIQGLNSASDQSDFLVYPELDSITTTIGTTQLYLQPTPGAINGKPYAQGIVADTKFDHDRGFYTAPFELSITTATPGAQIRYTTDGTVPTATTGNVYTGPILISQTSNIRAAAFEVGYVPTNVDTQTYIFVDDVVNQSPQHQVPPNFPASWGANVVDYGMDPRVVTNPLYSGEIKQDLLSIPSFSITMNAKDLFDPSTGIYANAGQDGRAWERPASIELINPDGSKGFQINAGVRIRGGFSRSPDNPKHAFRFFFRSDYGQSQLNYPMFGPDAAQSFQEFDLRTFENYSWSFQGDARFIGLRDQFSRDTQLAEGQPAERGNFYFLYINGQFWGLYNTDERPEANYAVSYFGGQPTDYDTVKVDPALGYTIYATDGTLDAWTDLFNQMKGGMSTDAAYYKVQGLNPDGTPNPSYRNLLDVDNLIDYMLTIYYTGNLDAPNSSFVGNNPNNFFAVRPHDGRFGFRFFAHDSEHTLLDVNQNRVNSDTSAVSLGTSNPAYFFQQLEKNPNFKLRVADHIQQLFFDDGALTPQQSLARFKTRMQQIYGAVVGESARWGDAKRPSKPFTRNAEWQTEINRIINNYLPQRTNIVLNQLKAVGLYPSVAAPSFNQHGGIIPAGFNLTMTAPAGTIYYTLDGSDPRLPDGTVSPAALVYSAPIPLNQNTVVKARALLNGVWSALEKASFSLDVAALKVTELMYNPLPQPGSPYSKDDFGYIELQNTGTNPIELNGIQITDAVTFTFPEMVLNPGDRTVVVHNRVAFQSRYGGDIPIAGVYSGKLSSSGEEVKLIGAAGQVIEDFTYSGSWYDITNGGGFSLVPRDPNASNGVLNTKQGWRPGNDYDGAPGAPDPGLNPDAVVVNEVLARTAQPTGGFIELRNTTASDVDISGWFLSDDSTNLKKYQLPAGSVVPANGYLVFNAASSFGSAFTLNSAGGSVFLTSIDAKASPGGYREDATWGASDPEVSFGRYTRADGGTDFVAMLAPTPGGTNSTPRTGSVILNEVMYDPAPGLSEYIELHNTTGNPVPLFDPANPQFTWKFTDGIDYALPPNVTIAPFGYIVISGVDPATFRTQYRVPAGTAVYGPFNHTDGTNVLSDNGENLALSEPEPSDTPGVEQYVEVDRVHYQHVAPWPTNTYGTGPSLSRVADNTYGNDYTSWKAELLRGSPGGPNFDTIPPTGSIIPVTPAVRHDPVNAINIVFSEPVANFDLSDLTLTVDGGKNLLTSAQTLTSSDGVTWTLGNLSGITTAGGQYLLTVKPAGFSDLGGNPLAGPLTDAWQVIPAHGVFGRFVFYNDSVFDGNRTAVDAGDDGAIATDKVPLLPGQTASFVNYTSYDKGLNGIMIDIAGLTPGATLTAADISVTAGANADPGLWVPALTPRITVRPGAGTFGSDRVELVWRDSTMTNTWVQVTVHATANTGLPAADVFYFGNAIAESGNDPTNTLVTSADELAARNDPHNFRKPALVTNAHDYNRDGRVDATDQLIARANVNDTSSALALFSASAVVPAASPQPQPQAIATVIQTKVTASPTAPAAKTPAAKKPAPKRHPAPAAPPRRSPKVKHPVLTSVLKKKHGQK